MPDERSVLVVDDDDAIRTLITRVLLRANFDVAQAGNGSEALAKLRTRPFRTVVLDLMIPRIDGGVHGEVASGCDTSRVLLFILASMFSGFVISIIR